MREVAAPHQVLDADVVAGGQTLAVVLKGHRELAVEVEAGSLRQVRRDLVSRHTVGRPVQALQVMRHPAGLPLGGDKLQAGEAGTNAADDDVAHDVGHGHLPQRVTHDRAPMRRQAHVGLRGGQHMHNQRQLEFFGDRPELVIRAVRVGPVDWRHAGDVGRHVAHVLDAAQLFDCLVDVVQRDAGRGEEALGWRAVGVVEDPVVEVLERRRDDLGVLDAVDAEHDARKQDFGVETIDVLVLDALHGVEDAGPETLVAHLDHFLRLGVVGVVASDAEAADREAALVADLQDVAGAFDVDHARRGVTESLRKAVEDLACLHDVGVTGNAQLWACHVGFSFAISSCPYLS